MKKESDFFSDNFELNLLVKFSLCHSIIFMTGANGTKFGLEKKQQMGAGQQCWNDQMKRQLLSDIVVQNKG